MDLSANSRGAPQAKLAARQKRTRHGRFDSAACVGERHRMAAGNMKARIIITPKKAVLDPQGKTVQNALEHLGYQGIRAVHVGKYIEIELDPAADPVAARKAIDEACHRFLSNPTIEDYYLEIV